MQNQTPSTPVYGTFKSAWYNVPGSKGNVYRVTVSVSDGRALSCTCPDHTHRRRECKHMRLVGQADHGGLKIHLRYGPVAELPERWFQRPEYVPPTRAQRARELAASLYA